MPVSIYNQKIVKGGVYTIDGISLLCLGIQKKSGRWLWKTLKEVQYYNIIVPAGFIFDGGSIPKHFWWFLSPYKQGMKAYLIHDWLYTVHTCSRSHADRVLYKMLVKEHVGTFRAGCAWVAVRAFGGGKMSWDAPNTSEADLI